MTLSQALKEAVAARPNWMMAGPQRSQVAEHAATLLGGTPQQAADASRFGAWLGTRDGLLYVAHRSVLRALGVQF